jgi:hypothetical protein
MRAFEGLPAADGLMVARVTYELLRPVPIGSLSVQADVVRGGKRVQLLEGAISDENGVEVARARALQVRRACAPSAGLDGAGPLGAAGEGRENDFQAPHRPMFSPDAIDIRFVRGGFHDGGPSAAWFRLRHPLVAGEEPSGLQRLAAAGDFGNGISHVLPWDDFVFINPDLTLYVEREPVGEWIGLDAQTRVAADGIGMSESVLYDERGRVGRATQALLVAPR